MSKPPIAVFDSGLGGLTVLKALRQRFPQENYVYLGDTARLPYGTKSAETIKNYNYQNVSYLKKFNPKVIVVACNSASSVLSKEDFSDVPVVGVISSAVASAVEATKNKKIGVIGTRTTIQQAAYVNQLHEKDNAIEVFQQACPLFVPLVEEGWLHDPVTNLIVYRYINSLVQAKIDTLILGCTHYPLLTQAISKVTGNEIQLIDPAEAIPNRLVELEYIVPSSERSPGSLHLLCTDVAHHFKQQAEAILNEDSPLELERIDL
tara:strand:+ start:2095 stop:2883 length:789 start_codon:yes stop_codon:yes gene_type:complete